MTHDQAAAECQKLRVELEGSLAELRETQRQAQAIADNVVRLIARWDQVLGAFVEGAGQEPGSDPADSWKD